MRIWHSILAVFLVAVVLTLSRDQAGRAGVIFFALGAAELIAGLGAVFLLFQAVGSLGEARGIYEHVMALASTGAVLVCASILMNAMLWLGLVLVERFV